MDSVFRRVSSDAHYGKAELKRASIPLPTFTCHLCYLFHLTKKGNNVFTIFLSQEPEAYKPPQIPSFIWPQMAYMPISDPTAAAAALIQASVAARVALEVGLLQYLHR